MVSSHAREQLHLPSLLRERRAFESKESKHTLQTVWYALKLIEDFMGQLAFIFLAQFELNCLHPC